MEPRGQNELHLVANKFNKLMIIFYMNIIFQYFSITLFSSKKGFVTNNSKKITHCPKKIQIQNHPMNFMSDEKLNVISPISDIKRLNPLNFKQEEQCQSNNAKTTSMY
jgi:hypothetical protein